MESTGLIFEIEADSCRDLVFEGIAEFVFLSIIYIIQSLITKKFDLIVLLFSA